MRDILKRKWHRVPVFVLVAVLAVALTAGVVAAAYAFGTISATIDVGEPMSVQYSTDGSVGSWVEMPEPLEWSVNLVPGTCKMVYWFRLTSSASHNLLVKAVLTAGPDVYATYHGGLIGLDSGLLINSSDSPKGWIELCASGAAAPGTYNVTLHFTRESPTP